MKVRLPLVGQPNQRNLDSLQALIEGKDQRYSGGIIVPIYNPLTGAVTHFFEKRPGLERSQIGDCEGGIDPGCNPTAIFFSRATGKYITAFCETEIFVDCDSVGDTGPDEVPAIDSTFWNPLDVYGATLSNDNYTVTINNHGDDGIAPSGGLENTALFASGKWYWEIEIEECETGGNFPTLSFGFTERYDGLNFRISGNGDNPSYDNRNLRVSDESILTPLYPDGFVWHSNEPLIGSRDLLEALGGNPDPTVEVDLTGVSGFEAGDILMFAYNGDAGKLWLGKNGTWFNSGNPAAGTNPQVTGLVQSAYSTYAPSWRLFFATNAFDYQANPVVFNGAFGNSTFPQTYSSPTGFTSLLPESSADFDGPSWAFRLVSNEMSTTNNKLAIPPTSGWGTAGTLDIGANAVNAWSAQRMRPGGKYYFELVIGVDAVNTYIGIRDLDDTPSDTPFVGTCALWNWLGEIVKGSSSSPVTLHSTGVQTYAAGNVLMFAIDLVLGKMWIGKAGTWANSGDPENGTNQQFSNIPVDRPWILNFYVVNGSKNCGLIRAVDFAHTVPTGFRAGIPLTVAP